MPNKYYFESNRFLFDEKENIKLEHFYADVAKIFSEYESLKGELKKKATGLSKERLAQWTPAMEEKVQNMTLDLLSGKITIDNYFKQAGNLPIKTTLHVEDVLYFLCKAFLYQSKRSSRFKTVAVRLQYFDGPSKKSKDSI